MSIIIPSRKEWMLISHIIYKNEICRLDDKKYFIYVSKSGELLKVYRSGKIYRTFGNLNNDNKGYSNLRYAIRIYYKNDIIIASIPMQRYVMTAYISLPEDLTMVINHKDGNPMNNQLDNLEWMTSGDNQRHAYKTNLKKIYKGSEHRMAVINEGIVNNKIIPLLLNGYSDSEISKFLDNKISSSMINRIRHKKAWLSVTINYTFPTNKELRGDTMKNNKNILRQNMKNSTINKRLV